MKKRSTDDLERRYPTGSVMAPCVYPADDPGKLEATLNHHVRECEQAKWPHALRWFTNLSYLLGNQYASFAWDTSATTLTMNVAQSSIPLLGGIEATIPRSVDNKLIRPYENLISLFTEIRPKPRVTAQSDSPEDTDAQSLSEIVVDLKWEAMEMPRHMRGTGSLLAVAGTCIAETFYGASSDVPRMQEEEPESETVTDVTGEKREVTPEPQVEEAEKYAEDCQAMLWSPFHFSPDPGATEDPKSLLWYYRHQFVDRGWVADNFLGKDKADGYLLDDEAEIPEASGIEFALYWWERIKDIVETPEGFAQLSSRVGNANGGFAPNQTLLRVWGVKPSPDYPKGRTFIQAGEKLIYAKDEAPGYHPDFPDRWHKLAVCRFWTIPGRFWGVPLLSELLPLQKKINAIDSLVQINREYMTLGQWLIPEQCKVQDGSLSGIPGVPISYMANSMGAKPEKVPHDPLPAELIGERELAERSIERLSATEGFLSSEAPSAVRAASMIDLINRQLRQSKSPTLQDFSEYNETICKNILIETQIHLNESSDAFTKKIIAAAKDRASHLAIATFVGADLRGNVDVSIDMATELLRTPEAKQQRAGEALQYIGKEMSPVERQKALSIMGLEEFAMQDSSDYKRAKRMIALVTSGEVDAALPMPMGIDNPTIFMQLLKVEMQSDRMAQYDDRIRNKLMELYAFYAQQAQQQAMEQMKLQLLMEHGAQPPQQPAAPSPVKKAA